MSLAQEYLDVAEPLGESIGIGRTLLFHRTREVLGRTPMELLMERRLEHFRATPSAWRRGVRPSLDYYTATI